MPESAEMHWRTWRIYIGTLGEINWRKAQTILTATDAGKAVGPRPHRRPDAQGLDGPLDEEGLVALQGGAFVPDAGGEVRRRPRPGLPLLRRPQGAFRLQRPSHRSARPGGPVASDNEQAPEAGRRDRRRRARRSGGKASAATPGRPRSATARAPRARAAPTAPAAASPSAR